MWIRACDDNAIYLYACYVRQLVDHLFFLIETTIRSMTARISADRRVSPIEGSKGSIVGRTIGGNARENERGLLNELVEPCQTVAIIEQLC